MNVRVFILFAVTAAFAAIWSSDSRYQAEQLALRRTERMRAQSIAHATSSAAVVVANSNAICFPVDNAAALTQIAGWARSTAIVAFNVIVPPSPQLCPKTATDPLPDGRTNSRVAAVQGWGQGWGQGSVPLLGQSPSPRTVASTEDGARAHATIDRLAVALVINIDAGDSVNLLSNLGTQAASQFVERFCLLRFRMRQMVYFGGRRTLAFLRILNSPTRTGHFARIRIREIPLEETQAPAANGHQTR
jgi:hypothetical protein